MIGEAIAHYRITAKLGEGGMGVVYRAKDIKLDREAAVKVLPPALADDPERMASLEREAKVLASLNHPNIAAVYGLEQAGSVRALAMELVEGPTLADRVAGGSIPLPEALDWARQIAEALEYAHGKGVIHRDLKPANVKITSEGVVKVLDFGLAKVIERGGSQEDRSNSPTRTMSPTQPGMILGTASYMSPEQASGRPIDRRCDIWSFGVVLWEMLCGIRLFGGETIGDILAAVIRGEIDMKRLPARTPTVIQDLLGRCLDRDTKTRLRDIGEARITIQKYLANPQAYDLPALPSPVRAVGSRFWVLPWVLFLAAVAGAVYFRRSPAEERVSKTSIMPPENTLFGAVQLSPNGRRLAFVALDSNGQSQIWVRPLDGLAAYPLQGTLDAIYPFWSGDSRHLGFFAGGKLRRIEATGGPVQVLCDAPNGRGGAWNQAGVILFAPSNSGRLYRIPANGGEPKPVTATAPAHPEHSHRWPAFLPDGRHFLYQVRYAEASESGIFLGDLDSKDTRRLTGDDSNAVYSAGSSGQGYLLFARNLALVVKRFDATRFLPEGEPSTIADHVSVNASGYASFSVSDAGDLVYDAASYISNGQLTWFDRNGKQLAVVGTEGEQRPRLSPDEKTLAIDRAESPLSDSNPLSIVRSVIWLIRLPRALPTRFTIGHRNAGRPVWSPDGGRLAFLSYNPDFKSNAGSNIYEKTLSTGAERQLLQGGVADEFPTDWSPDGRFIVLERFDVKTKTDLWILPLEGDHKPIPFLQTQFNETEASFSPDGGWIAYASDESGKSEVYIEPFPGAQSGPGAKRRISDGGGTLPKWRRDGREMFYLTLDQKLMSVDIRLGNAKAGSATEIGVPQLLFQAKSTGFYYELTRDGQRFLFNVPTKPASGPVTLVMNWTAGLSR